MLSHMLQGNIIHYPVYLFLLLCFYLHLFLPRAMHATPTYNITSLGFLTPGSLAESILSPITNIVFKDSELVLLMLLPSWLVASFFCFAPSGHKYCLSLWLSSCSMTGVGGGKRKLRYSLQTYFWLQHKSHPVCLFCWITICLALLNYGRCSTLETYWCKHLATNEHKRCQCFTVWTIRKTIIKQAN